MGREKITSDIKKFADENSDLFSRNLQSHGKTRQLLKCCEEMSELNVELCKYAGCSISDLDDFDFGAVYSEMADVIITLTQAMNILDCFDDVEKEVEYKLERLNMRLRYE